jgi:hypothetical protein
MHAHDIGHAPGHAAPEAATSVHLTVQEESAPVARTTQSREKNEQRDFATTGSVNAFATLCEQLATKGYCLTRAYADDGSVRYFVGRWGLCRELANLAEVRAFAERVGVTHG